MNKKYILIGLTLCFLFYWFQLRPAHIKSDCANGLVERAKKDTGFDLTTKNYDFLYTHCLRKNGL